MLQNPPPVSGLVGNELFIRVMQREDSMSLREWSKSELAYGHKVLDCGIEGARCAQEEFLRGTDPRPFLWESVRHAFGSAALGACLGILGSYPGIRRSRTGRMLSFGFLGGAIGFGAGVAWESRCLAASVALGALRNMGRARDEHWLERHPIDYA